MLRALLCPLAAIRFSPLATVHQLNISHFFSNFNSILWEKSQNIVLGRVIVYIIRNRINGKCYVGQTKKSLAARWKEHIWNVGRGLDYPIYRAIRKYGLDAFTVDVLHLAKTPNELNRMETFFIVLHQSHLKENGYNLTLGGEGLVATDEVKEKLRKAGRKRKHSKATRRKMSKSALEAWTNDPERRQEFRERFVGSGNPFYGKTHSQQSKDEAHKSHIEYRASAETKQRLSTACRFRNRVGGRFA